MDPGFCFKILLGGLRCDIFIELNTQTKVPKNP